MTKAFLRVTVVSAVCSLLSASAWAQSELQTNAAGNLSADQTNRAWSTKHLSATGRMNEHPVRASTLVGAQVNDSSGNHAGQIQDVILNPVSGRIDFALLTLGSTGSSSSSDEKLVPVPWSLLRISASSQYSASSEQPMFTLNAEQSKLRDAPAVNWSDLSQSQWRQRIYAYYGVSPEPPVGGANSPEGEIKGEGAPKLPEPPRPLQQQPNP